MDRGVWRATIHGVAESDMTEQLSNTSDNVHEYDVRFLVYNNLYLVYNNILSNGRHTDP